MIHLKRCRRCKKEFKEIDLELSHDIPKYLGGTDADGRHWLCKKHHDEYECWILIECLRFLHEDFSEDEKIEWMKELKKQPEELKKELRKIAIKVKEEWYG